MYLNLCFFADHFLFFVSLCAVSLHLRPSVCLVLSLHLCLCFLSACVLASLRAYVTASICLTL